MSKAFFLQQLSDVVSVEQQFSGALDPARYQVAVTLLGDQEGRIAQAEEFSVKSVPALASTTNHSHQLRCRVRGPEVMRQP